MALRTTRITVETETFMVVRSARATLAWCPNCASQVDVIVVPATSLTDPETALQIQQWVESGNLHLWHTPEGAVRICVVSLLQSSA